MSEKPNSRMTYAQLIELEGKPLREYVRRRLQGIEPFDPPLDPRLDESPAQFIMGAISSQEKGKPFTAALGEVLPELWKEVTTQWVEAVRQPVTEALQEEWHGNQPYLRRLALVTAKSAQFTESHGLDSKIRKAYRPILDILLLYGEEYGQRLLDEDTEARLVQALALLQPLVPNLRDLELWEGYWDRDHARFYGPAFLGMIWSRQFARKTLFDHLGKALERSKDPDSTFSLRNALLSFLKRNREEGPAILREAAWAHGKEVFDEIRAILEQAGVSKELMAAFDFTAPHALSEAFLQLVQLSSLTGGLTGRKLRIAAERVERDKNMPRGENNLSMERQIAARSQKISQAYHEAVIDNEEEVHQELVVATGQSDSMLKGLEPPRPWNKQIRESLAPKLEAVFAEPNSPSQRG